MTIDSGECSTCPSRRLKLACMVSLPPPFTGRTIATDRFLRRLGGRVDTIVADLGARGKSKILYRLSKVITALGWMARLLFGQCGRPDYVYIVANHGSGLWIDIAFVAIARLRRLPVVVHHHVFSYFNRRRRRVGLLFRMTGKGSFHLVLCERMRRACLEEYATRARILVMPNFGADSAQGTLDASPRSDQERLEVVFISNLTHEKGIGDVLQLVALCRGRKDVRFRIAGPAMDDRVQSAIENCREQCGGIMEWLGAIDDTQRERLLGTASLFLFPTRYANEAQPLVLIEALEAGVPVVTNSRGCIAELIDPQSGVLVEDDADFVSTAARTIDALLFDSNERAAMSASARQRAQHNQRAAEAALDDLLTEMGETKVVVKAR